MGICGSSSSSSSGGSSGGGGGSDRTGGKVLPKNHPFAIPDRFKTLEQVQSALRDAGLEY